MVAALVPQHLMGFILGMWFLTQAAAFLLGGYVATFTAVPENITDPLQTLPVYTSVFGKIGLVTLGVTVVMALMVPWLKDAPRPAPTPFKMADPHWRRLFAHLRFPATLSRATMR